MKLTRRKLLLLAGSASGALAAGCGARGNRPLGPGSSTAGPATGSGGSGGAGLGGSGAGGAGFGGTGAGGSGAGGTGFGGAGAGSGVAGTGASGSGVAGTGAGGTGVAGTGASGSGVAGTGGFVPGLPVPTPQQLAWQDLELGLFIHFDMATYTGATKPRMSADPNLYNPRLLNTDQWLEVAKTMGAQYAVFVAKHCTGFLSWQSNAYPFGVKQSAWRGGTGDVVREFIASCNKYGIKPGLYSSVTCNAWWGADNPGTIQWGNKTQADYARANEAMATELWSNYGPLTEIWLDGGALPPSKGGPDLVPILERHQPDAIFFQGPKPGGVRWIGNERGVAAYPCWSTVSKLNDPGAGDPNGKIWNPGECDVPLPGYEWFWHGEATPGWATPQQQADTLPKLMDMYYRSVGHNCNLLLNATPDATGLIPEVTLAHYMNFGNEIQRRFGTPVAETQGDGEVLELTLPVPSDIDHVIIMEALAYGERVRAYTVEGLVSGNNWQKLSDGVSVGHKRIQSFPRVRVAKVRFTATQSTAVPKIRRLAVFNVA
ncbi:MAG: alpha-L-fucosidase [Proteobacteria bacterium]|nr:alpha-L-fucosidase [Pseudomonadota bacterium]